MEKGKILKINTIKDYNVIKIPKEVSIIFNKISFVLTDTKNVICALYSRCPLDENLEYFLGVLHLGLLALIRILFCYIYVYTSSIPFLRLGEI